MCAHADDTRKLIDAVQRADVFVLTTLVEWMGRAPLAAAFVAKLNALESRDFLEGKVGGLIVTYEQMESGVGNDLLGALSDMEWYFRLLLLSGAAEQLRFWIWPEWRGNFS